MFTTHTGVINHLQLLSETSLRPKNYTISISPQLYRFYQNTSNLAIESLKKQYRITFRCNRVYHLIINSDYYKDMVIQTAPVAKGHSYSTEVVGLRRRLKTSK